MSRVRTGTTTIPDRTVSVPNTDTIPRRHYAHTVNTDIQIEAIGGVLDLLAEHKQSQSDSTVTPDLRDKVKNFLQETKPNETCPGSCPTTKRNNRSKLLSSFGTSIKRSSKKLSKKGDKSEKKEDKEDKLPAASIAGLLLRREISQEELHSLFVCLQEKPKANWIELFLRLGGVDGLFQALYPPTLASKSPEIQKEIILCILELFKDSQAADAILPKLALPQEVSFEKEVAPKGSMAIRKKRTSLRLDQMKMIARSSSSSSVSEPKTEKGKELCTKKETMRLSQINILLSLYEYVVGNPVESLIRPTTRLLSAICRKGSGAENLLAELHRMERTNRKSSYLTNATHNKSEGSTRMACKNDEALIKANVECLYLLPILDPVISGTGEFLAEYWTVLNCFIGGLESTKTRFSIQNTALQLGILPNLLTAHEHAKQQSNGPLTGQLELFHHFLTTSYEEMSNEIPASEHSKYPMLQDKSNSFLLKMPLRSESEAITLPYTPEMTMVDILERAATKQQYLRGDNIANTIVTNLFLYALFLEDRPAGEGCYYSGQCIRTHSQVLREFDLQGQIPARIGLLPWNINVNLSNILPEDSEIPMFLCISVSPDAKIQVVVEKLKEHYLSEAVPDESADYCFYFPEDGCWLETDRCWESYSNLHQYGGALLFMPRYRPIRVKYGKETCEMDWLDYHLTVEQMREQLFKKFKVSEETKLESGLFLFPLPTTDEECGEKTYLIAEERGWKKEEQNPGTYLLSLDIRFNDIIENFPKRNFLMAMAKRPRFLSIGLRLNNKPNIEKKILTYFDSPVRDLVKLVHNVFGIEESFHCSLAIAAESGEGFSPLRKQSSLTEQSITPDCSIFLCPPLFSDDPFDDEANIWEIQITPESSVQTKKPDGTVEMKAGTLNVLVRHLTNDQFYDSNYTDTFLLTYESFTSSEMLLRKLIERFQAPTNIPTSVSKVVQQRVCVVMKNWVSKCMPIIPDQNLLREIALFANEASAVEPAAKGLQKAVVDKLSGKGLSGYHFTDAAPEPNFHGEEMNFDTLDVIEIARQLTLSAFGAFQRITYRELFGQPWSKVHLHHKCPSLMEMITQFNYISSWVTHIVITTPLLADRVRVFSKCIQLAVALRELGNFSLLTAVISGLNNSAITRLKWTKAKVSRRLLDVFEELEEVTSMYNSFKEYRSVLAHHVPPVVPYMGVYCSDLTFMDDGNPDMINGGLINFYKRTLMFKIIKQIEIFQQVPYNLKSISQIQKWIYNFEPYDDEKLYNISLEIEPRNAKKSEIL